MKAKIKPRINLEGRTPLETIIPLPAPFVVFVDPASVCNFRCKFCPTGDRALINNTGRQQGLLDFELYKKVIDDIAEFDRPLKVLRLYKDGEPLLNKHFVDMVRYAKHSGCTELIDTTTNGSLLTKDLILQIIDAGIDRINISVDGLSSTQFLEFAQAKVDFDVFVENIRFLYENRGDCEICIKTPGDNLSEADKQKFYDIFGDYCDRIFIENFAPCWPEFDVEARMGVEIEAGIYNNPIADVKTCPYIFYSTSVNSDGTVSLCFLDWARKLIIGDVREQSLREIWEGDKLFQYQLLNLQSNRMKIPVCSTCGQLSHCLPDNIDGFAEDLATKLIASRTS